MSDVDKLKEVTVAAAIEVHTATGIKRIAYIEAVAYKLGWSHQKIVALWRNRQVELGGTYHAARFIRGNPREFNCNARQSRWTEAAFVLTGNT